MEADTNRGIDLRSTSGDPLTLSENNDLYGYYEHAVLLAATLMECATPLVVGIYGRWGRGKSTFLKTIEGELRKSDQQQNRFLHLTYSPWQYHLRSFDDTWASLISELSIGDSSLADSLKDVVKSINGWRLAKGILTVGADFLPSGAEVAKKAIDMALPDNNQIDEANDYIQFIQTKKSLEEAISDYLEQSNNGRVFVYIDDLDRCEPEISVAVLRAIQLLCRIPGCIFVLGLDRDVTINNLIRVYNDRGFAKEYLDKIVQLHIELPVLYTEDIEGALLRRSDGTNREELEPFLDWIIHYMTYNPRKVERFALLYDYKLKSIRVKDFQAIRQAALFTAWELRWPELATERAKSREILNALEEISYAENEQMEMGILQKYSYLSGLKNIQEDREFIEAYRRIQTIEEDSQNRL